MYKKALQAAKDSLEKLEISIKALESAQNFKEFSTAWTDFLMPAGRIFSKLEEGSKSNSKSIGWFAARKHERKTDPLLNYIRVARNADEHGIAEVARQESGHVLIWGDMSKVSGTINTGLGKKTDLKIKDGSNPPTVVVRDARIALITVTDKYKVPAPPPTTHMGASISDPESPIEVAKLALAYFSTAIEQASKLPE